MVKVCSLKENKMNNFKRKILIDLDGVLNEYGKEKFDENFIPEIKKGAKEFIENLHKDYDLYLFTSRNLLLASKWLVEYGLDGFFRDVTNSKIPAYLYIDDRALTFDGDFDETFQKIKNFKVYWK